MNRVKNMIWKNAAAKSILMLFMLAIIAVPAERSPLNEDEADYAPIVERKLDFYDFTLKSTEGQPFNLRQYAAGKKIVIINFLAGWCKNSNRNGHVIERLYNKYRDQGLGVVAVTEYSEARDINIHINRIGIDYPVVTETQS